MTTMRVLHISEKGVEKIYVCESAYRGRHEVILNHGRCISTELADGEVLILGDDGKCVHRWNLANEVLRSDPA